MEHEEPLESVVDTVDDKAGGDKISLGEVLDALGSRSFGPILTVLALIAIIPPIGAIPGLPAMVGFVIIIVAAQMIVGRQHIWLPAFFEERSVSREKLRKAKERSQPYLAAIDRLITARLTWAAEGPALVAAGIIMILLSLSMVPLELLPFAVALPGSTIALIGLGITAKDGLLMLVSLGLTVAVAGLSAWSLLM